VVVVDLRLKSGTSGLSVLRWLHANEPRVAAIVLSNSAYAQMKQACLDLGAWCVLDKTSEFAELGTTIVAIAQQLGLIA
jgi:DNA-binding NarL/FixJ family response regulator